MRLRDERQFYNEDYPKRINPGHSVISEPLHPPRLERAKKYLTNPQARVLEVGSARGDFLNLVRPHVASVVGCDFNRAHCRDAKERFGIDSYEDIAAIPPDEMFDLVFMFQVLEHIPDPHDMLSHVSAHLRPGGLMILDVPNVNEALFRLYRHEDITSSFFFKVQHPFTYSVKALGILMRQHALAPVEVTLVQYYTLTNHLNWIYTSKGSPSFAAGMQPLLPEEKLGSREYRDLWVQLDAYYRTLLVDRGFSDTIFAVFRKEPPIGSPAA